MSAMDLAKKLELGMYLGRYLMLESLIEESLAEGG